MDYKNVHYLPVSVVVTVFNESESIIPFLEDICNQSVLPAEIIICDGGSTDKTVDVIKQFIGEKKLHNIKVITSDKRINIAKGRNIAIREASNRIIAVTDGGCRIDKFWLEEITRPFFEEQRVDVVSGFYKALIENSFHEKIADIIVQDLKEIEIESFLPSSRSIAFKKDCWEKVGGYPESLRLCGEDTLFDILLRRQGYYFVFNPKAIVYWKLPQNYRELAKKFYNYGYGDAEAKIKTLKYLFYILSAFLPIFYIFTNKKFKKFFIRYFINLCSIVGFIKGKIRQCC